MITVAFTTLPNSMLDATSASGTAQSSSGTPSPSPEPSANPAPELYTLDECFYHVNTSSAQKAVYAILAISLAVNLAALVWWSRPYFYKRKYRRSEEEDYPDGKDMDEISLDDLDVSINRSARPRRVVTRASSHARISLEEGFGGRGGLRKQNKAETGPYDSQPGVSRGGPTGRMRSRAHDRDGAGGDEPYPPGGARARMTSRGQDRDFTDEPKPYSRAGARAKPGAAARGRNSADEHTPYSRGGAKATPDRRMNDGDDDGVYRPYRPRG